MHNASVPPLNIRGGHCIFLSSRKSLIRDCKRSILRGLGPDRLKDSLEVAKLEPLIQSSSSGTAPWDPDEASCFVDAVVPSQWFMLRKAELASLRRGHVYLEEVVLLIAVRKNALRVRLQRSTSGKGDPSPLSWPLLSCIGGSVAHIIASCSAPGAAAGGLVFGFNLETRSEFRALRFCNCLLPRRMHTIQEHRTRRPSEMRGWRRVFCSP